MWSIIVYAPNQDLLDKTIDGIIDTVPAGTDIIACIDDGSHYERPGIRTVLSTKVGRAKAYNLAARAARGDRIVFMRSKTKVCDGWLEGLAERCDDATIVGSVVHTLDTAFWTVENSRWKRFGFRWDLEVYDRPVTSEYSPVLRYCLAIAKNRFEQIGRFDEGMKYGSGEDIEICVRNWLLGGSVVVSDESKIAVVMDVAAEDETYNNLARIISVWFPAYASVFQATTNRQAHNFNVGNLSNLLEMASQKVKDSNWFIKTLQPELLGIYDLRGTATGKTVAVVAPGPSLDCMDLSLIYKCDIVIGVDYTPLLIECDYIVTDILHAATVLAEKYDQSRMLLPLALHDSMNGRLVSSAEVFPGSSQFELAPYSYVPLNNNPPFCNFENMGLSAIHLATFLGASSIMVFGMDNKLVCGLSHTSKIEFYDGGRIWNESEVTTKRFATYEYGLGALGYLGHMLQIPIMRVNHA